MTLRNITLFFTLTLIFGCGQKKDSMTATNSAKSVIVQDPISTKQKEKLIDEYKDSISAETITDGEYQDFYVVVVDSSKNHQMLHAKMIDLAKKSSLKIDSLGRIYDANENKIKLPEDSEDDIYAGEYYPRRGISDFLSIEYSYILQKEGSYENKSMILVAGIFGIEEEAQKTKNFLSKFAPKVFIVKAPMYMGCMH